MAIRFDLTEHAPPKTLVGYCDEIEISNETREDVSTLEWLDGDDEVDPHLWLESEIVRWELEAAERPLSANDIERRTGIEANEALGMLMRLTRGGFCKEHTRKKKRRSGGGTLAIAVGYTLTDHRLKGNAAGAPKQAKRPERGWGSHAARLSWAIAKHYCVTTHEMLKGASPVSRMARGRLCAALMGRGWSGADVERYYAMRPGEAMKSAAEWRWRQGFAYRRPS